MSVDGLRSGHRQRHAHGFAALRSGRPAPRVRPRRAAARAAAPGTSRSARARHGGSPVRRRRRGPRPPAACPRRPARAAASSAARARAAGTSSSSASSLPPPSPKIAKRSPEGVVKPDMFSTTPAISSVDLVGHLGRAARDLLGGRLRRGDDQEARLREQLGERHRDVARAGRQVDEQIVQRAPFDVLEELGERLVEHRAAPDDGRVLLDEEADRHHLHAVGLERDDLALGRDRRAASRRGRTCAGSSSPRRPRRARRRACLRRRARRRGSPSASTCRRRPCPSRCRSRSPPARASPRAALPRPSFCCSAAFCSSLSTSK